MELLKIVPSYTTYEFNRNNNFNDKYLLQLINYTYLYDAM